MLEPSAGQLACTVLRGGGGSDAASILDRLHDRGGVAMKSRPGSLEDPMFGHLESDYRERDGRLHLPALAACQIRWQLTPDESQPTCAICGHPATIHETAVEGAAAVTRHLCQQHGAAAMPTIEVGRQALQAADEQFRRLSEASRSTLVHEQPHTS
jgi:hypothetical protein